MTNVPLPQLTQNPDKPRSTRGRWRAAVLIGVHLLIVAHFLHWHFMGDTLAPVEPSESAYALRDGVINVGLIFFAIALLSTLVFGRFVCGWGCHFVAVQDLCSWLLAKVGIRPKPFRSRLLLWAPLGLALYLFVWQPLAPRLFDGAPLLPPQGVSAQFTTSGFWDTFPPLAIAIPFFLVCGGLIIYFLGAKGFCTYACPYGGFFAPLDKLSPYRVVVDKDKCKGTGHCTAVCTSNVRVHQEVADYGKVVDPGCMKCTDCISACPNGALSLGWTRPALFTKTPRPARAPRGLSWGEDLAAAAVFVAAFLAAFRAYGPNLFPLLFAAGIAACMAPVGVVLWNLPRKADMRFARLQLKRRGRLTRAGAVTGLVSATLLALTFHTGYVNFHRWRVDLAFSEFNTMGLPARAFLSGQTPPLTDDQRALFAEGVEHAHRLMPLSEGGAGLVFNERAVGRAAVLLIAMGEFEEAGDLFERIERRSGPADAITATRARLLIGVGDREGARELLESRLPGRPAFWESRDVLNALQVASGRTREAIDAAERALAELDDTWRTREARARTHAQLARLFPSVGERDKAVQQIARAARLAPESSEIGQLHAVMLLQLAGDQEGAIEEMRRVVEIDPDAPGPWLRLAQLAHAGGRAALADEAARRFVALENESDEARRLVAPMLSKEFQAH